MLEAITHRTIEVALIAGVVWGSFAFARRAAASPNWHRWSWGIPTWAGLLLASSFIADSLASDHRTDCAWEWPGAVAARPGSPEAAILAMCHEQNAREWWAHVVSLGLVVSVATIMGIRSGRVVAHRRRRLADAA